MFKSIRHRLFPLYEARVTREAAEALLQHAQASRAVLQPAVQRALADVETTVYSIRIDHMRPDQIALMLLTNVIGEELGSGRHHVYRGRLGVVGLDMQRMWNAAQDLMVERGYASGDERKEDDAWLQRQVSGAG